MPGDLAPWYDGCVKTVPKIQVLTLLVGALMLLVAPGCPEEGDGEDGSGETEQTDDSGGGW